MAWLPVIWASSRNVKSTATAARLDSTITEAAMSPQPPIHPTYGPKACVAQVNDVPESGTRVFSAR